MHNIAIYYTLANCKYTNGKQCYNSISKFDVLILLTPHIREHDLNLKRPNCQSVSTRP